MHTLTWYRHLRYDGAIRTAVEVDGVLLLHRFENESDEPDPALLWYVDLRCEGVQLPSTPAEVRQWLLEHAEAIRRGIRRVAQEFRAGVDVDIWPLQRRISGFPRRIKAWIVFSAARRLDALAMAEALNDVADHWDERIASLQAVESSQAV